MSKDYNYETPDHNILRMTTYGNESYEESNCLIYVHGFKGFKDWGFVPFIADYFSKNGFFVITFNFSHNGIGNNPTEFTELDKFAQNTYSLEVKELNYVIDAYLRGFFGNSESNKIGLIGHSRGGAVSLLTASQKSEVSAAATWSSIAKLDRYSERQKTEWRKSGKMEALNTRTKQVMRMDVSFLEDLEENSDKHLNLKKAVENLNRPYLIVHGDQDLAVPVEEAHQLYEWSDKQKTELFLISSTGHTFNAGHPFDGSNDKLDSLINKTLNFFRLNLN